MFLLSGFLLRGQFWVMVKSLYPYLSLHREAKSSQFKSYSPGNTKAARSVNRKVKRDPPTGQQIESLDRATQPSCEYNNAVLAEQLPTPRVDFLFFVASLVFSGSPRSLFSLNIFPQGPFYSWATGPHTQIEGRAYPGNIPHD